MVREFVHLLPLISSSTPNQLSPLLILLPICLWASRPPILSTHHFEIGAFRASHFVHPSFQNWCLSLKFCLGRWVGVQGREGSSSTRVQNNGEGKPPSWCVDVMEGGRVVMSLLRVFSLGSGPWTTVFDQLFGRNFDHQWPRCMEEGSGHGALSWAGHRVTCQGHWSSWWRAGIFVPLLKCTE